MEVTQLNDCIFCKIANKEIPSDLRYEDDYIIAFPDIKPEAPVHWLIVPKAHLSCFRDGQCDAQVMGHLFSKISEIAKLAGVYEDGFRVVVNTGDDGGQTVMHFHAHLLGGRFMEWPPG